MSLEARCLVRFVRKRLVVEIQLALDYLNLFLKRIPESDQNQHEARRKRLNSVLGIGQPCYVVEKVRLGAYPERGDSR